MNSNGPGGTSGAHTTCCEEWPVLWGPSSAKMRSLYNDLDIAMKDDSPR